MSTMQKSNSSFCFTKVYVILLIIIILQIGICLWVGRLHQNLNETKRSLDTHCKNHFQKGFVKNESLLMSQKLVQDIPHKRKNKVNKIQEVIVLGPLDEFDSMDVTFNDTFPMWKIVERSGSLSLHEKAYIEIGVEGFYQINTKLRITSSEKVTEFYSYYLLKNKDILASTTFSSSQSTGDINFVTHAKRGDRLSLYSPWNRIRLFVSKPVTYFCVHYI